MSLSLPVQLSSEGGSLPLPPPALGLTGGWVNHSFGSACQLSRRLGWPWVGERIHCCSFPMAQQGELGSPVGFSSAAAPHEG